MPGVPPPFNVKAAVELGQPAPKPLATQVIGLLVAVSGLSGQKADHTQLAPRGCGHSVPLRPPGAELMLRGRCRRSFHRDLPLRL